MSQAEPVSNWALAARRRQFGHGGGEQSRLDQQPDTTAAIGVGQDQAQLGRDPLGADHLNLLGHLFDGLARGRIDLEAEHRGEPHGPQQPQLVFAEPGCRIADRSNNAAGQIVLPADEVDHLRSLGVVEQAVDREVAALGVVAGRAEGDGVGMSAVGILGIAAERGHLDLAGPLGPDDGHHAEGRAHGQGSPPAEQLADLVGPGARRDVVILGIAAQQLIADATAGQIGLEARGPQLGHQLDGKVALGFRIDERHDWHTLVGRRALRRELMESGLRF